VPNIPIDQPVIVNRQVPSAPHPSFPFYFPSIEAPFCAPRWPSTLFVQGGRSVAAGNEKDGDGMLGAKEIVKDIRGYLEEEDGEKLSPEDRQLKFLMRKSVEVLIRALGLYSFDGIALSFNGGKDCLVLLLLYLVSLDSVSYSAARIPTCFVVPPHSFTEVDEFVTVSAAEYNLDIVRSTLPMKESFRRFLQELPQIKGILVGTRRSDPFAENLHHFDETDHGWPPFMRIHPVIDWHYADVWNVGADMICPY